MRDALGIHHPAAEDWRSSLATAPTAEIDTPNAEPFVDERRVRLNTLVESGARRFTFLYDFGDGWEHTVKIEDLVTPPKEGKRIRCLARENACPPEDVGEPPPTSTSWLLSLIRPTQIIKKTCNGQVAPLTPPRSTWKTRTIACARSKLNAQYGPGTTLTIQLSKMLQELAE